MGTLTKEILEKVNNAIIEKLEKGVNPWQKPWKSLYKSEYKGMHPDYFAYNYVSKKAYTGINQILLQEGLYVSMKQIQDNKFTLKKGSKGSMVVFYKKYERKASQSEIESGYVDTTDDNGKTTRKYNSNAHSKFYLKEGVWTTQARVLKYSYVYNILDCENVKNIDQIVNEIDDSQYEEMTIEEFDEILKEYRDTYGIKYEEIGSSEAFFSPMFNTIRVPRREQFNNIEEFYATACHEHGHSTGIPLKRDIMNAFGSQKYSYEELVAEITSAYALGYMGVATDKTQSNSSAYLKSWANRIKGDNTIIEKVMKATNDAKRAFELIFKLNEIEEGEE